jgi:lipopolysaccharide/colanic/teichoic acid biosynthesis glycosyltransferase
MAPWSWTQRAPKRALDVLASTVALVMLSMPLLLIGLLIKMDSKGPALFKQPRLGRGGRLFHIWKLRTMVDGARGSLVTADGDRRVTRVGRFLRRTKLDELPQLVNVWLGDMSLVGPRPEVPRYLPCYSELDRIVLEVRPGITDPASIWFRDEERVLGRFTDPERAYKEVILPLKLELGREYVRGQSFTGDLGIIMKTLVKL